jgi:hypothetical protein
MVKGDTVWKVKAVETERTKTKQNNNNAAAQ